MNKFVTLNFFLIGVWLSGFAPLAYSNELTELIAKNKPSIVAVGTYRENRSPNGIFLGTGFAVAEGDLIITNAHVLPQKLDDANFERLAIFYRFKQVLITRFVDVKVIDSHHDIALLRLESGKLPALELSEKSIREGETIFFTGYPIGMVLGLYAVTHKGIVSSISPIAIPASKSKNLNARVIRNLKDPYDVYQLDATAYPGNSGSPVFDSERGEVIGIVNKVFVKASKESAISNPSGITYAIPVRYLKQLLNYGKKAKID